MAISNSSLLEEIPKRWPLITQAANRDSTTDKDAQLVNCIAEYNPVEKGFIIQKRPGLALYAGLSRQTDASGHGIYNWKNNIYTIFDDGFYRNGAFITLVDNTTGGTTATNGTYRFIQGALSALFMAFGNGVKAYYTDGTVVNQITDVNFPTSFVKGFAYLDGTLYVMTPECEIFGSKNLDDPAVWDALNVIIARGEPGRGIYLTKHLSYVVAMKEWTIEFFFDAANSTGSPLGPVPNSTIYYGCLSPDGVRDLDGILFWISSNRSAGPQVCKLEGMEFSTISNPAIERLLEDIDLGTEPALYSFTFKHGGHRYFGFTIVQKDLTLIWDIDQKLWYRWCADDGSAWRIIDTAFTSGSSFKQIGQTGSTNFHTGNVYYIDNTFLYPTDAGTIFPVDIYTPGFDAGVDRSKHLPLMTFNADQVAGSILKVRYNDSDFAEDQWSNFRQVNLGNKKPMLPQNGSFVKRSMHLRHEQALPFRITSIGLTLGLGTL